MTIGRAAQPVAGGALPVTAKAGEQDSRAARAMTVAHVPHEPRDAIFVNGGSAFALVPLPQGESEASLPHIRNFKMPAILLTAPAVEPLSLDDAKAFLRVEHDADDDIIAALIAGARIHVEAQTRRALITQAWRLIARSLAGRRPPAGAAGAAARADRGAGLRLQQRRARRSTCRRSCPTSAASALSFVPWALPAPGRLAAGIELDVTVGYGDAASDVPEPLRQAIRLLVAHWYENRGAGSAAGDRAAGDRRAR